MLMFLTLLIAFKGTPLGLEKTQNQLTYNHAQPNGEILDTEFDLPMIHSVNFAAFFCISARSSNGR